MSDLLLRWFSEPWVCSLAAISWARQLLSRENDQSGEGRYSEFDPHNLTVKDDWRRIELFGKLLWGGYGSLGACGTSSAR